MVFRHEMIPHSRANVQRKYGRLRKRKRRVFLKNALKPVTRREERVALETAIPKPL